MNARAVSAARRREVIDALRRGTVPQAGLDLFAVGLERFEKALDEELAAVATGGAAFKAVRGEYGSGKTFFARWLAERAKRHGFAVTEIQISETETPLHRLETVYRRLTERLATASHPASARREVVDGWFYTLEEDVLAAGDASPGDMAALARGSNELMERRLAAVARTTPAFAAALRAYRHAVLSGETAIAEGLIAWLGGQPNVAAAAKRAAGIKGDLDHFGALGFLQGLLTVLLAQRLATDYGDPRFDNPRAVQIRLSGFDIDKLVTLGCAVRDLYADGADNTDRIRSVVDDVYVADLAQAVTGRLGGQVGVAPRIFLRKLVEQVLDRVDQFPEFDPRTHYKLTLSGSDLTEVERNAWQQQEADADDVDLDL